MKIIKPSVEYCGQVPTDYEGNLRWIERAGRLCYKSEDKIAPGTAEKFVEKLTAALHWAMLEHSNFVIRLSPVESSGFSVKRMKQSKYLNTYTSRNDDLYVGGNLRAWLELVGCNSIKDVYRFLGDWICPHDEIPPELHRYTIKFTCDRGVSHELVRHRPCSFAQESTRYVNYGGKDMEFIEPAGCEDWTDKAYNWFFSACVEAECRYLGLLDHGLRPEQARAVLPNALKTEVVVTADPAEWAWIKGLRLHKAAHPDMQRVMAMVPWGLVLPDERKEKVL